MKTVFLCLIFGSIISCALSAEGDSNARLLISKHILNQFVVEGKELTVHYSIYNVGSGYQGIVFFFCSQVDWGLFSLMSLPTILIPFLVWFRSHSKYESHKHKRH
ncbi:PREDICTED: translocon-associated protein subunit beta-like [Acropora digitifera]|uniref:translocon-associated protein subunit beta-like n=1 Tax=Acropora digitifera TaxID=70779 RepID=UPI00077A9FD9|nr:PREDICTED: translocon-associated protein subunit beta-like [Acropora digitifera]